VWPLWLPGETVFDIQAATSGRLSTAGRSSDAAMNRNLIAWSDDAEVTLVCTNAAIMTHHSAASVAAAFWPVFCSSASEWAMDTALRLRARWRRWNPPSSRREFQMGHVPWMALAPPDHLPDQDRLFGCRQVEQAQASLVVTILRDFAERQTPLE
jgi:hypothetical protein